MARPSSYSAQTADSICNRLSAGESLLSICDNNEELPDYSTVFRWLQNFPEFRDNYAHAREVQAERHAEQILAIADDLAEDPNSRRVRVDSRKWLLSKLIPKKYGDATMLKHADANGEPFKIEVTRVMPKATRILEIEAAKDDSDDGS